MSLTTTRNAHKLNQLTNEFLKRNFIYSDDDNKLWQIKQSELGGFGVFANRDIQTGELIFKDCPIIIGPRAALTCPAICVNCYKKENLEPCTNNCGLPVCSLVCQNSPMHQKECKVIRQWKKMDLAERGKEFSIKLMKSLTPVRSLLLSEEDKELVRYLKAHRGDNHGHEVEVLTNELNLNIKEDEEDFMRFVCSVLDSNAFEVIVGDEEKQSTLRGLYPLGSLANHSCLPNTIHVFDDKQRMVVRAAVPIPANTEIFHSYTRFIWGTHARRFHLLRTKHFLCKCERCQDPTEFGTYMSAILCKKCRGKVISLNPLKIKTKWQCEDCKEIVTEREVASLNSLLGSTLNSFDVDWRIMLKFLNGKLPTVVPEFNETAVELKYRLIWVFGYHPGLTWSELPDDLLLIKEKLCRNILILLNKLGTGQCKMKGLVLYELYCSLKEITNRRQEKKCESNEIVEDFNEEMRIIFDETADILKYDVSAPKDIKMKWIENDNIL